MKLNARFATLHRLIAVLGIALTLVLGCAAASPAFHDWLHGETAAHGDATCVVALFTGGVTLGAAGIALVVALRDWREVRVAPYRTVFVAAPRYLRLPERAPPVG